jgi:hypothetical protein
MPEQVRERVAQPVEESTRTPETTPTGGVSPSAGVCLNCGTRLTGAYCAQCGQRLTNTDLTLREFLTDTTAELANWEGRIPQTLRTLFSRPGLLTLEFLAGRRARWLPPLRVYLICSLAYFLAAPFAEALTGRSGRQMAQVTITNADGGKTITPETRREIEQGIPARLFGAERLVRAASDPVQLNRAVGASYPKAMFILLPVFALLTNIAWRRVLPRYPAHLYLALHVHAAMFGALAIATFATAFVRSDKLAIMIGLAGLAYAVWYVLASFRRVFGQSWSRTILKAIPLGAVYLLSLGVVSVGILGYVLATI